MDRHPTVSVPVSSTAAIPELDTFDLATFDALPIWGAPALPVQAPAILVVDDELHVGQIVRRLLQETLPQQEIIAVTHPTAALEHLRSAGRALEARQLARLAKCGPAPLEALVEKGYARRVVKRVRPDYQAGPHHRRLPSRRRHRRDRPPARRWNARLLRADRAGGE